MIKFCLFIIVATMIFLSPLFAMTSKRVEADKITESSILDGDSTAIVEGCGNRPIVGFTYCRQMEGEAADKAIIFVAPPSKCKADHCAFLKVWNSHG